MRTPSSGTGMPPGAVPTVWCSANYFSIKNRMRFVMIEGGYYAQGNKGRGALEDPAHRAILEGGLSNALGGSNVSNWATDNASGSFAAGEEGPVRRSAHRECGLPGSSPNSRLDTLGPTQPRERALNELHDHLRADPKVVKSDKSFVIRYAAPKSSTGGCRDVET